MYKKNYNNLTTPLRYPSQFDKSKWVSATNWVLTQAPLGHSTGWKASCFEKGHSILFIEAVVDNERRMIRFDYQTKPPAELTLSLDEKKYITPEGKAWLHKDENSERLRTKTQRYINHPKHNLECWEIKKTAAKKLLIKFQEEFNEQISTQIPAKDYSIVWENCHFLIAEKFNDPLYKHELQIDTANINYIEKFHMGGWKYAIVLNFKTSILFATLISPLQVGFISYILQNGNISIDNGLMAKYDSLFPIMVNFFNHTSYLLRSAIINSLSDTPRKSVFDFGFNFIISSFYLGVSLGINSLASLISVKNYPKYFGGKFGHGIYSNNYPTEILIFSIIKDLSIPLIAILTAIGLTSLALALSKKMGINLISYKSLFIEKLFNLPRLERLHETKTYLISSLIPICGFIFNVFSKYGMFHKATEKTFLTSLNPDHFEASLFSFSTGCLIGYIFLKYFTHKTPSFNHLFQPLLITFGSLLPIYYLMKSNLNYISECQIRWTESLMNCASNETADCNAIMDSITLEFESMEAKTELSFSHFGLLALVSLGGFLVSDLCCFVCANWQHIPSAANKAYTYIKNKFTFFNSHSVNEHSPLIDPEIVAVNYNNHSSV